MLAHTHTREKTREKKKEKTNVRTHASRKKNANNSALLVGGSVCVKTTRGQRRRGKKKDIKQTKNMQYIHTPLLLLPTTHVCISRRVFFSLILFFLTCVLNIKVHISSSFSEHKITSTSITNGIQNEMFFITI